LFEPAPSIVIRSGIIRSARMQRGCGRAVRRWRHVVSDVGSGAVGRWH
jgi:hypothetical protein